MAEYNETVFELADEMKLRIVPLEENVFRFEDDFVYFYLVQGEEKALVIDSGVMPRDVKPLLRRLTDKPLILVNTHGDGDHLGGTGSFEEFYISSKDYVNQNIGQRFQNTRQNDLKEGDIIELGNRPIRVIEVPGHTFGSVVFLDEKYRTLYAGDTVQDGIVYMFGSHRCPQEYLASLRKLMAMKTDYDRIYAFHGTPTLSPDYAELVLKDWKSASIGEIEAVDDVVHGIPVKRYMGAHCGFYC